MEYYLAIENERSTNTATTRVKNENILLNKRTEISHFA